MQCMGGGRSGPLPPPPTPPPTLPTYHSNVERWFHTVITSSVKKCCDNVETCTLETF